MTTIHGHDLRLSFGIEFEGVLEVKSSKSDELTGYKEIHRHMSRAQREDVHQNNANAVKQYLHRALDQAGLASEVRAPKGAKNYALWGIESDGSLTQAETQGQSYGVEIVSPVLSEDWERKLQTLFRVVENVFNILDKHEAATHIHIAPLGRQWSMAELRSISKSLVASTDQLRHLLPRTRDMYCEWNDEQWNARDLDASAIDTINKETLVERVSVQRQRAWNFQPLLDDRGTIEFRRPYQSLSYRDAAHWVTLTLGLFSMFLRHEHIPSDPAVFKRMLKGEVHDKLRLGRLLVFAVSD